MKENSKSIYKNGKTVGIISDTKMRRSKSQRFIKGELKVKDKKVLKALKEFVPTLVVYDDDKTEDLESEIELQEDKPPSSRDSNNEVREKILDEDKTNESNDLCTNSENSDKESNTKHLSHSEKSRSKESLSESSHTRKSNDSVKSKKALIEMGRRKSDFSELTDFEGSASLRGERGASVPNLIKSHSTHVVENNKSPISRKLKEEHQDKGGRSKNNRLSKMFKKAIPSTGSVKSKERTKEKTKDIEKSMSFWLEGKSTGVFGIKLEDLIESDNCNPPIFLLRIVNHLNTQLINKSLQLENLFDAKQNSQEVLSFKDQIDSRHFHFDGIDNRCLFGLLKLFFSELPDPLFGIDQHRGFFLAEEIKDLAVYESFLISLIFSLPEPRRKVIQFLSNFFFSFFFFFLYFFFN